jgi:hypothetical protein
LKQDYDRLHRLATNTAPTEFVEPKTKALWKMAQEADFTDPELESVRQELHHYEQRLIKLHHLNAELKLVESKYEADFDSDLNKGKGKKMDRKLTKHAESVDKLHAELASKIASRHSEL